MSPLLTALGTLPSPPSPLPTPYPRDPLTGNTVRTPFSQADHTRQRLKLVRAQHAINDPLVLGTWAETALAKHQVRFAALHAARQAQRQKEREARHERWDDPDPFVSWDSPPVLPGEAFFRAPAPACVAVLSGVPTSAWGYGRVCMVHPVREDPFDAGQGVPVFAGEVGVGEEGMGLVRTFDPVAREERTERFDLERVERAVFFAERERKRDLRERCLRCVVKGLPCSLERGRNWEKGECEGCRRNGCKYCLRVVRDAETGRAEDDRGREARYQYVLVKKGRGVDVLVYVRGVDGEVDVEEVRRCAQELVDGEGVSLWGTTLDANDRGAMVLPSWKDGYCKTLTRKNELDTAFVREWRGDDGIQEPEIHRAGVTWQDYFKLLDEKWRHFNPYKPREPRRWQLGDGQSS